MDPNEPLSPEQVKNLKFWLQTFIQCQEDKTELYPDGYMTDDISQPSKQENQYGSGQAKL